MRMEDKLAYMIGSNDENYELVKELHEYYFGSRINCRCKLSGAKSRLNQLYEQLKKKK